MLTKEEVSRVKYLWNRGWPIDEITDDCLAGRYSSIYHEVLTVIDKQKDKQN